MKQLFFAFLFCLGVNFSFSQVRHPAANKNNSLLWEISGNGLEASSYLFGTYHLLGKSFVDSLVTIRDKFNTCKIVVSEVVIDSSFMEKGAKAMYLDNNTLDELFTAREYHTIAAGVKAITGITIDHFNNLKPITIELTLMSYIAPRKISEDNPGLDKYFQEEGLRRGDRILAFETVEEQVNLLFNVPIAEQKKRLLFTIKEKDATRKNILAMYNLYVQQDLAGLYKMISTDKELTIAERDAMLKNRNLSWVNKIPAIINSQPAFIAVGAGHLVGKYGLINQLRLKGYTVTPVKI